MGRLPKLYLSVLSGLLIVAASHPASAVEYGGIGGKPAYPQADNARTESIFVHTLQPEQTQAEGVLLLNNTTEEQTMAVYAVDSVGSSDGAFACAQHDDVKEDVGSWMTLEKTEVTLAAGTQEIVPFTITVPADADVGEHNGCIVIQKANQEGVVEGGMSLSFRSAMRVAITVPGDIIRQLNITQLEQVPAVDEGLSVVTLSVANSGNVSLDADTAVVTRNLFGQSYFVHDGTYPVLRGATADWHYELPNTVWGGWFQSTATVSYDAHEEASLGQDSGLDKTELTAQTSWFFLPPSTQGLMIELAIVLVIVLFAGGAWMMHKRQAQLQASWVKHEVKKGEDLEILAQHYAVSWKTLAKVNRLVAPYRLKVGDKLLVPPIPKQSEPTLSDEQPASTTPAKSSKAKKR